MSHIEVTSAQTLVTTAETIIGAWAPFGSAVPAPAPPLQQNPVEFTGTVNITPGTTTSAITLRIRAGGITGVVIGTGFADNVVAGVGVNIPFTAEDTATGDTSGYVLTAQQTAATANGTVNYVSADAIPQ